jgi:50S ribosomal protein L16 3-hydroxylase
MPARQSNVPSNRRDLNLDRAVFLREHWQREPLLIRQALSDFYSPLSPDDLAFLACQPNALARLVQGRGKRFTLEIGPFSETRFESLSKRDWTLLVQDVDKLDRDVSALLRHFDFLPRWRIEDIMVSYAVTGGSVGAHVDQYDVFLLQAQGSRRWQIDTRAAARRPENQRYLPKLSLRLLEQFDPNQSFDLHPGDMLYLPPGVPHHGISLSDDCMTFSIGMRAPSHAELIEAYALDRAQSVPEYLRFRDAAVLERDANALLASELKSVSDVLFAKPSDTELELWLCTYFTRFRSMSFDAVKAKRMLTRVQKHWQAALPKRVELHPSVRAMRCVQRKSWVIGGFECRFTAKLGEKFVNDGMARADLQHLSAHAIADLHSLIASGLALVSKK